MKIKLLRPLLVGTYVLREGEITETSDSHAEQLIRKGLATDNLEPDKKTEPKKAAPKTPKKEAPEKAKEK